MPHHPSRFPPRRGNPVSTASIPPFCFEEPVIHQSYHNAEVDPDMLEGPSIDFLPIPEPNQATHRVATPMQDCLRGFGLRDPGDRLFQTPIGKAHIQFMIIWPGYPELKWIVPMSIYGSDSQLVTRRELARRIAVQYQNFAIMAQELQSHDHRWRVGPGGYTFERMRLVGIQCVKGDIWRAHIAVLTDVDADFDNYLIPMRDL